MQKKTFADLHPIVQKLLINRNLSKEDLREFISWDLKQLPDLTALKDIKKASARIIQAINKKEKIAVYGDYDVDGTTSCALFFHFFQMLEMKIDLFQPDRFHQGYGLHESSIDDALEKKIDLIITVDCGITNHKAATYAQKKGLDLIITDHHKNNDMELPCAIAVINPNRSDENCHKELKTLAGVGVAFALCLQIKNDLSDTYNQQIASLYPLLQFVAIGTICDLAALTSVNLKLVRHGISQMLTSQYPGIRIFFSQEERQEKFISSEKLSFSMGPLINSKGRLEHPQAALDLLICNDPALAYKYHSQLTICNNQRKEIQSQVFKEAKEQITSFLEGHELLISVPYAPHWHEGVIGIVASRLVETFKVPAIVFTNGKEKNSIKASARSAGDLDLFGLLTNFKELFIKFGGHKKACGLSMPLENLKIFKEKLRAFLEKIPAIERTEKESIDLEIEAFDVCPELVRDLELLEPFGQGNERPIFRITNLRLDSYQILKEKHVRWNLSHLENPKVVLRGISFNYIDSWNNDPPQRIYQMQHQGQKITIDTHLSINRWKGNQYIQLQILKISC